FLLLVAGVLGRWSGLSELVARREREARLLAQKQEQLREQEAARNERLRYQEQAKQERERIRGRDDQEAEALAEAMEQDEGLGAKKRLKRQSHVLEMLFDIVSGNEGGETELSRLATISGLTHAQTKQ